MTTSRSITSASRVLVALAVLVFTIGTADAGGRKRIVVLDFEGPKAEKFHDELVKLIKKSHTVVPVDKWNGAADELDAGTPTEKNIKKVARKLKIDGVITGKIEKRRDEYILRIKLHAGSSGEVSGNPVETKADGPRIDGQAQRDLKDELLPALDDLEANHGGGDDDSDDKPAKKSKKSSDDDDDKPAKKSKKSSDDDDDKPAKKSKKSSDDDDDSGSSKHGSFSKRDDDARGGDKVGKSKKAKDDDDEDKPAKKTAKKDDDDDKPAKKTAKKDDDDDKPSKKSKKSSDDDDDKPAKKTAKKDDDDDAPKSKKRAKSKDDDSDDDGDAKKKTAKADDDDASAEAEADVAGMEPAVALSPSQRAIDATGGLSFTARRLGFTYNPQVPKPPPGYKQSIPVGGAYIDITVFPLAWGHKPNNKSPLAGLGVTLLYDRVLSISSQKAYIDMNGATQTANLPTAESRFAIGAVYRYPIGVGALAPVVGGKLIYGKQSFDISQQLPDMTSVDIPNVDYSYIEAGGLLRYPVNPKIVVNVDGGIMAVTNVGSTAGAIGNVMEYGETSAVGFEFSGGFDYMLTKNIFARAMVRVETIGMTFKGDPSGQTNNRDTDPTTQDVSGARDTYFGGAVTVGYLY